MSGLLNFEKNVLFVFE